MLGIVDIVVLGVLLISVLFALYRGLVRELLGISSWILAAFVALYSYDPLQKFLDGQVENLKIASIVGSVVIALIVMVIVTIINAKITHKLRKSSLSGLDRILGLFFGIARAGLVVALAYLLAASFVLTKDQIKTMEEENKSVTYIQKMAEGLETMLPESMQNDLKSYEPEKTQKVVKKAKVVTEEYKESDRHALDKLIENIQVVEGMDEWKK